VLAVEQDAISFTQGNGLFSDENIQARLDTAVNLDGNSLPRTPEWTLNADLSRQYDLGDLGELIATVNLLFVDSMIARPFDNPERDRIPSYTTWGASAQWDYNEHWRFSVIGSNLADKNEVNNRFTDAFGVGATGTSFIPPRQVKVRAGYRF